jgi:hypothetical protein
MSDTLTLEQSGHPENAITIRRPDFGYTTSIKMRLHFAKIDYELNSGSIRIWDDGASYDSRHCKISQWLLNTTEQNDFVTFMNDTLKGRCEELIMKLGSTPSGFFPFGADLGDKGDFHVRVPVDGYKEGKLLYDPLRWWENDITFCLVPGSTLPSYTPPAAENEGSLLIGTVAHLLCPQESCESEHLQAIINSLTGNGGVDFIDKGTVIDDYQTVLPLEMRPGNCASLITFLTGADGRAKAFHIECPANQFPFGIQFSDIYYLTVTLMSGVLEINHVNFNRFLLKLKLKLSGAEIPG